MNPATELHSSTLRQIGLIAWVEIRRLLSQTKGLMTLAAYVLLWLLLLLFVVRDAVNVMQQPQTRDMVLELFGEGTVSSLFNWPVAEYALYWVFAIMLQPLFAILLAAGQFADDIHRGTFRYLSLHCSRTALFFGRFCGAFAVMALLSGATVIVTMLMAIARDAHLVGNAIISGTAMWIVLLAVLLPYIALMSLLSVIASSSKQAIVYATLYFTLLSIVVWSADFLFAPLRYLDYILPGAFSSVLYSSTPLQAIGHLGLPLAQCLVFLALGFYAFKRSDV
ncbi:hypothetical protein HR45_03665 [Shewanella mangrovi]|uniref:ABC transporter n=1 Tax=Shewanella mangrovi TaxID=1515746 RepID=A0A094JH36_9GAMM|nr:ABC transporter permease subunit [Shewanella mangrovi]KFZ38537.1 hypothetical protein HR45_03665 [Shewanella mangrovi]